jgi:hypothetical protein
MGYPVEIKVNVAGPVQDAQAALDLDEGKERRIWFLEDLTPGLDPPLPLLAAGVILRVRGGKNADSTAKLRPCRRTQLTDEWSGAFQDSDEFAYRVEEDWTGARRSLAASAVRELEPGQVDAVTASETDPGTLFCGKQRRFLRDCADLRINLDAVTPLGPVRATKWKNIAVGDFDTTIERWSAGNLDFLELSIRVGEEADQQQKRFEAVVRDMELPIDEDRQSKTRRILAELARAAPPTGAHHG